MFVFSSATTFLGGRAQLKSLSPPYTDTHTHKRLQPISQRLIPPNENPNTREALSFVANYCRRIQSMIEIKKI
jgi:hypothetical protein